MGILEVGKNDNVYSKEEVKQRLNVEDYVFEIGGKDITQAEVAYSFDELEIMEFKDGKKYKETYRPVICIEISGIEPTTQENAWLSFELEMDLDALNKLSEVPTDVSKYLFLGETFIKRPNEETSDFVDFVLADNTINDIYRNLSSIFISKIDENVFMIKVSVPTEVFTYFKIDFNN